MIPKSQEGTHLVRECPLQVTPCIHGDKGCDAMILRKEIAEHLKECIFDKLKLFFNRIEVLESRLKSQTEKVLDQVFGNTRGVTNNYRKID
jgi:hypothetical protein